MKHSPIKERGIRVSMQMLPVGELRLNPRANRDLRPGRVRELFQTMDYDALGQFTAWRDGRDIFVIDGQHRKAALEKLGQTGLRVRCTVYEGATFERACDLFLKLNHSLTVRPYDKFDKGCKAGIQKFVETKRIIEAAGLNVAATSGDGKIVCVSAVVDVFDLDGDGTALARTLDWTINAWGRTAPAVEGQMLRGLGRLAHNYNGEIDDAALIKKLAKFGGGPAAILGAAKSQQKLNGRTIGANVADTVTAIYNKGRRVGQLGTRLP